MSELIEVASLTLIMLMLFAARWFVSANVERRDALGATRSHRN